MALRWFIDLGFARNVCVGRVHQLPAESDAGKGVRPSAPWQAYGMATDWDDTNLGNHHHSRADAKKAIENWYRSQITRARPKIPCAAHAQFRPGCVGCEALRVERRLE